MQRSTHMFLNCLVLSLAFFHGGYAEKKQSIASAEFLSALAKNVATVLSPTLVGELQDGRPNRTATNTSIATSTLAAFAAAKAPETTTEPSKSSYLEADTVRSAQTQSEVRPGNRGFPFNLDDNNYRYNYPGINPQSNSQIRPDFPSGPFGGGNPGYYNPELYRGYAGQAGPEAGLRPEDSGVLRGEQGPGVASVDSSGNGQAGRVPDSPDPSAQNFDRFRNFDRFPFGNGNQFGGGPGNFQNFPFQSQRQDGRFGQPLVDQYNPNLSRNPNLATNPNLLGNPNGATHPNLLNNPNAGANPNLSGNFYNPGGSGSNNFPRNPFPSFGDPYVQRQQGFPSNSFDPLQSQRFQNPSDNYPRSLQRGPNFPGFYPGHFVPDPRDSENFATPAPRIEPKKVEVASSDVSTNSASPGIESKEIFPGGRVTIGKPEILSVQGKVRFGRLLLPALEDYSDVRFQPDSFRQYLITPSTANDEDKKNANSSNINSKDNINDV